MTPYGPVNNNEVCKNEGGLGFSLSMMEVTFTGYMGYMGSIGYVLAFSFPGTSYNSYMTRSKRRRLIYEREKVNRYFSLSPISCV